MENQKVAVILSGIDIRKLDMFLLRQYLILIC